MNSPRMPAPPAPAAPAKPSPSIGRIIWRVIYWGSILIGLWWLMLMLRRAPAPPVERSAEAARSAQQKLDSLAAEPPSLTTGGHVRIVLSEEELNSLLAARLNLGTGPESEPSVEQVKSSVRNVEVTLTEDRAQAFLLFNLAGKDLTLQLEGHLHVSGGYLRFQPTGGSLGELAIPQSALDAAIAHMYSDPEKRESFRVAPEIRDIYVENGALVIERQ